MIARTRVAPPAATSAPWYYLGLDLGQANDYSALAIAGRDRPPPLVDEPDPPPAGYAIPWLQRWQLGTPYPAVVAETARLVRRLAVGSPTPHLRLVVDMTGVGRPVVDLLRRERLPGSLVDVTITGGDAVARDGLSYRVPKRDLVSTVQVLLQGERLKVTRSLPDAETLMRELLEFRVKISAETAHDSYGAWREGTHDDLVLAAALATWYGEHERLVPEQPPSAVYQTW